MIHRGSGRAGDTLVKAAISDASDLAREGAARGRARTISTESAGDGEACRAFQISGESPQRAVFLREVSACCASRGMRIHHPIGVRQRCARIQIGGEDVARVIHVRPAIDDAGAGGALRQWMRRGKGRREEAGVGGEIRLRGGQCHRWSEHISLSGRPGQRVAPCIGDIERARHHFTGIDGFIQA